jgi:signal transduction histidine kinase
MRSKDQLTEVPPIPDDMSSSALSLVFNFGQEWSGRILIFDPHMGRDVDAELRFAQTIVRQVGPALYSVYLLRRLRSRAGAIERARVARELHDGAIQSLIAVENPRDWPRNLQEFSIFYSRKSSIYES